MLHNIAKQWILPIRDWKAALKRFTILFERGMPVRILRPQTAGLKVYFTRTVCAGILDITFSKKEA